jgi:hypothetical protein
MLRIRSLVLLLLMAAVPVAAQAPRTFSFQGVLADGAGAPVPDGAHVIAIRLYDNGGASVYTETQTVTTVKGVFNAIVGSVTPIPISVDFNGQYTLGLSVDGGVELSPRTPIASVPSAMRASVAESLAPGAAGVVTSLNGATGPIVFEGGGGTTVNRVGNVVTISSTGGGGSGIAGVQSSDGSINITSPNGPVASINVADAGVTAEKLAAGSVTPAKINFSTATEGNALVFRSGSVQWGTPNALLSLPFSQTSSAAQDLFALTSSSTFGAGYFRNTNTAPTRSALYGEVNAVSSSLLVAGVEGVSTNGFGVIGRGGSASAGIFGAVITTPTAGSFFAGTGVNGFSDIGNGVAGTTYHASSSGVLGAATGTGNGVRGISTLGIAGKFEITNSANTSNALYATTNGAGYGILGSNTMATGSTIGVRGEVSSASHGAGATAGVTGVQGVVTPTTPGGYSAGVRGVNNGTGGTGIGVVGFQGGSGWGVYGETPSGFGVYGLTTNNSAVSVGVRGETFSTNGLGVEAKYSGTGVGIALEVDNGGIKVSGVNKAAFVHTATAANKLSANGTDITNPMCDGDPTAILLVTQKLNPTGIVYNNSPIGVYYNTIRNKWEIFNENNVAIPNNAQFNVLVIKQ